MSTLGRARRPLLDMILNGGGTFSAPAAPRTYYLGLAAAVGDDDDEIDNEIDTAAVAVVVIVNVIIVAVVGKKLRGRGACCDITN